ncbi:hypothetical protein ACTVJH_15755 [Desulfoplanes sp. PS50]
MLSFVLGIVSEMYLTDFLTTNFPNYFEDDTLEIIENQNTNYSSLTNQISNLYNSTNDASIKKQILEIKDSVVSAKSQSQYIVDNLISLKDENIKLRDMLKDKNNFDGGTDFKLYVDGGIKIDRKNSFGLSSVDEDGDVASYISNPEGSKRRRLSPGEGIKFLNEDGDKCSVGYLGPEQNSKLFRFSINCIN